jgi:hypothetical protein
LDWDNFLPALMLYYSINYHSTISNNTVWTTFWHKTSHSILSESKYSTPAL